VIAYTVFIFAIGALFGVAATILLVHHVERKPRTGTIDYTRRRL
jgi:hypothetical protein